MRDILVIGNSTSDSSSASISSTISTIFDVDALAKVNDLVELDAVIVPVPVIDELAVESHVTGLNGAEMRFFHFIKSIKAEHDPVDMEVPVLDEHDPVDMKVPTGRGR